MALIRKIRDRGVTVLLIEHHMNVVMGISDFVACSITDEKSRKARQTLFAATQK